LDFNVIGRFFRYAYCRWTALLQEVDKHAVIDDDQGDSTFSPDREGKLTTRLQSDFNNDPYISKFASPLAIPDGSGGRSYHQRKFKYGGRVSVSYAL